MENWDDIRIFLATARTRSSRKAAEALGINQSTVSRRIRRLEQRSSTRLFDRQPAGLVLTDAGEELLQLAGEVETRFAEVDRRLQGRDAHLSGTVRLSMPDFMVGPTARHLAAFAATYPDIDVGVIVDNSLVSISRREADLVLRLATGPPTELLGRRIAPVWFGVYGSTTYLASRARPIDPSSVAWVRWEESWRLIPPEAWIDANVAPEQVRARVNTSLAHAELIAAGLGVGFQPCFTGDPNPRLVRAADPMDLGLVLWLLTHNDLRHTARIRALLRYLADALTAERGTFLGDGVA